jgi:hypothetical protein
MKLPDDGSLSSYMSADGSASLVRHAWAALCLVLSLLLVLVSVAAGECGGK